MGQFVTKFRKERPVKRALSGRGTANIVRQRAEKPSPVAPGVRRILAATASTENVRNGQPED